VLPVEAAWHTVPSVKRALALGLLLATTAGAADKAKATRHAASAGATHRVGLSQAVASEEVRASGTTVATSTYDSRHLLAAVTRTGQPTVTFVHDDDGRRRALLLDGATQFTYGYDALRRLASVTGPWGSTTVGWHPGGQVLASVSEGAGGTSQGWEYDARGLLRSTGGTVYTYDAWDNVSSESRGGLARTFTYAGPNKDTLTAVSDVDGFHGYVLNPDGRRATEQLPDGRTLTYTYGSPLGALTSVLDGTGQGTTLIVDTAGRVTSIDAPEGRTTLVWTPDGRVASANGVSFSYDGLGLRRGASDGRQWLFVGEESVGESFFAPPVTGLQPVWSLAGLTLGQGTTRYTVDALGSPVADSSGGSTTFSAWGVPSTPPLPGTPSVSFTGHRYESPSLLYAQQRWYLPGVGAFASLDSVGPGAFLQTPNSLSPWSYANGSPGRYVDRDGRRPGDEFPDPLAFVAEGWSQMWQTVMGGRSTNPCAGTGENGSACYSVYLPPKGMPGGAVGGFLKEGSFRLLPTEENPTQASLMGIEVGARQVPVLGPAQCLATGKTVTGLGASRLEAGIELALDVAPLAWELRPRLGFGAMFDVALREATTGLSREMSASGAISTGAESFADYLARAQVASNGAGSAQARLAAYLEATRDAAATKRAEFGGQEAFAMARPGIDAFPEWRVGDPITKITPTGAYPEWFSRTAWRGETIQGRYWMNRAAEAAPGEFSARQLAQMRGGFAPQAKVVVRRGGELEIRNVSKELHHDLGNRGVSTFDDPGALREVWPWQHEAIDPYRRTGYEFVDFVE
jgi:RHS repeat-associated protein